MKPILLCCTALLVLSGCQKSAEILINKTISPTTSKSSFTKYLIKKGEHYAEQSVFTPVETEALAFMVRFDSSAIYTTNTPENQYDINKLYGFADNNSHHHLYSARFGWRWSDGALRLFAYVYNKGAVTSQELGVVPVGADISCSIKVTATEYQFTLNDQITILPRFSTTPLAKGYLLYPYFGGDEAAPHDVNIWIKNR